MKIAALSFYTASNAFNGGYAGVRASANQFYDYRRDGDRRRKSRIIHAARITPESCLTTGLAMQLIAQIEQATSFCSNADRIEAARAAYRQDTAPRGAVINLRA